MCTDEKIDFARCFLCPLDKGDLRCIWTKYLNYILANVFKNTYITLYCTSRHVY